MMSSERLQVGLRRKTKGENLAQSETASLQQGRACDSENGISAGENPQEVVLPKGYIHGRRW